MANERPTRVIDFDGTVTDVQQEAADYLAAYRDQAAHKLAMTPDILDMIIPLARKEILKKPGIHGWEVNGLIVAPATADVYLFNRAIIRKIWQHLEPGFEGIGVALDELHQNSYDRAGTAFRDHALEFVTELHRSGKLVVVTNSETKKVKEKLATLLGGEDHGIEVVGNAKKYLVDPAWEGLPLSVTPPGFPRPVYLRRPHYHAVLEGLNPVSAVIGDVYELDLAVPEHLGITTVLVTTPDMTPDWEINHYQNHDNGFTSGSLGEILGKLT